MLKLTMVEEDHVQDAGAPASSPPMAKVVAITRSTLMPIMAATSLSSLTARMARPVRVRWTKT